MSLKGFGGPALPSIVNSVVQSSAQRLFQSLHERSVDAIILDPPPRYGSESSVEDEDTDFDTAAASLTAIALECARVLRPGGCTLFLGDPLCIAAWEAAAAWSGLSLGAELIILWDTVSRRQVIGSLSTAVRWHIRPGLRDMYRRPPASNIPSNVIVCQRVPLEDRYHAAQLPVELFNFLISMFVGERGLVVDPFCGTGSSLIAAEFCHRHYVGADIDSDMVKIAQLRIDHLDTEEDQLRPFRLWAGSVRNRVNPKLVEV